MIDDYNNQVPKEWIALGRELEGCRGRFLVFILGENDTGKSSLCRYLISHLRHQGCRVAWVDADLGQSALGPPTTVGMTVLPSSPGEGNPLFFRFVGSTSPAGHLLQTLVSVRAMVDKTIQQKVDGIILDTSGFVSGKTAREFKFQKIQLVNPTHLIALERGKELEILLKNFSGRRSLSLHRFFVPDYIQLKSRQQRWEYRKEKFQNHFQGAELINFVFQGIGLHGRLPNFQNPQDWQGLLIGFCDEMNDTLALGIIREVDLKQKQFSCLTSLKQEPRVRSIQFGSLYLDRDGRELYRKRFWGSRI